MNLLFTCIGKRGYIAEYFRPHLRADERIIGTSISPWTPGFRSCDLGLVVPPIASDEYIPAILQICRTHEVGGLLSFFDPDVVALSRQLGDLRAAGVVPLIPEAGAARLAFDKWETFRTLRDAGFAVPETVLDLEQARESLQVCRLRFPLIVKPRTGFGSRDTFVAHDERQLEVFFSRTPGMLIQQFVGGEEYNVEALSGLEQQVLQVVAWRKLLSRHGETEHAMTVDDRDLVEIGARLARAVGLIGPMDVDLIREPHGAVSIVDLNLRFGGGYPVSHLAGADFPKMIVDILRGGRPAPRIGQYRSGVSMMKGLHVIEGPP